MIEDAEYIEAVRAVAWGEAGKWENTPEGWPEGVDPKQYVRDYYNRTSPPRKEVPETTTGGDGPLTKLLEELRNED